MSKVRAAFNMELVPARLDWVIWLSAFVVFSAHFAIEAYRRADSAHIVRLAIEAHRLSDQALPDSYWRWIVFESLTCVFFGAYGLYGLVKWWKGRRGHKALGQLRPPLGGPVVSQSHR